MNSYKTLNDEQSKGKCEVMDAIPNIFFLYQMDSVEDPIRDCSPSPLCCRCRKGETEDPEIIPLSPN